MPIDSAKDGEKQTELLNEHETLVDHDQVSDAKYVSEEDGEKPGD